MQDIVRFVSTSIFQISKFYNFYLFVIRDINGQSSALTSVCQTVQIRKKRRQYPISHQLLPLSNIYAGVSVLGCLNLFATTSIVTHFPTFSLTLGPTLTHLISLYFLTNLKTFEKMFEACTINTCQQILNLHKNIEEFKFHQNQF